MDLVKKKTIPKSDERKIKILGTELFILHFISNKHCYILLN